ncbi:group II intron reverse transcriptase/maturase [Bacillus piscicola]|uniref:group II intron reverse transcriptase/maturase n=1 Tax=Bacillus piscicola TaxID=1632684 RepID=UPI001F09EA25|nr:group II intron reverse transcriptase/maturase [Bacillus piscicola]
MNVNASITCGTKHENFTDKLLVLQWKAINWRLATQFVNKIQIRITKAVQDGKRNLVKRLQYLLVNSYYAQVLSVKRVTSNKGKNTPGVDGEIWDSPLKKMKAVHSLNKSKHTCKPLKRVYIEKYGKKEKRPLSIPTLLDRAMQALYLLALEPIAETTADRVSFGFRKYRSTHDAMSHIFNLLSYKRAGTWILEGDIKGCFDNIQHSWLLDNIPMDKKVLNKFLKAGFIFDKRLFPTNSGTPQGGIISPTLANMTLDGMEMAIAERYWKNSRGKIDKKHKNHKKINIIRYADDFIVSASDKETLIEIQSIIEDFLLKRGLTLSKEKTLITHISEGFDFLGWNFRKRKTKLIISPAEKSFKKVIENIGQTIKSNKTIEQKELIRKLNRIIKGWCNYHQPVCSKKTFKKLNNLTWNMLWKWCKRRHPNKNKKWVVKKYWRNIKSRQWVFMDGSERLHNAGDTPIVRHIALKLDMNPFLDRDYFDNRKDKQQKRKSIAYLKTTAAHIFNGL